jgi:hypothetical protein
LIKSRCNTYAETALLDIISVAREKFKTLGTSIGLIAMESVSINENYQTIEQLIYRERLGQPTVNPTQIPAVKQLLSLAIFNIILLAEKKIIHGDAHLANLLGSEDKSYCGYFLPEKDNLNMRWAENKSSCFIDFGRTFTFDMLEKHDPTQKKNFVKLLALIKKFKKTGSLDILIECLTIIYDFGYFYKGEFTSFRSKDEPSPYIWFFKINADIANYVQQLFIASERAQQHTYNELEKFIKKVHKLQKEGKLQVTRDWSIQFISNILNLDEEQRKHAKERESDNIEEKEEEEEEEEDESKMQEDLQIINRKKRERMDEQMDERTITKRNRIEEEKEQEIEEEERNTDTRVAGWSVIGAFTGMLSWIYSNRGGRKKIIGGGKEEDEINIQVNLIIDAFITYTNGLVSISELQNKVLNLRALMSFF